MRLVLMGAVVLTAGLALVANIGCACAATPVTLVYTGALKDSRGAPVGGIFWFRFALHRGPKERKVLWSEEMYVAVDKGTYQVELGKERQVPQGIPLVGLYLSVAVDGVEVQRVQVDETMISGGVKKAKPAAVASTNCALCEVAERALTSDKIADMTVKQLLDKLAKKQIQVGTSSLFTAHAGSDEGEPFRLSCPAGFVVTGIKGKADDKIRNLQLVCSPLESK